MSQQELQKLVQDLQALPKECEWVEFKVNKSEPHTIGEIMPAFCTILNINSILM